MKRIVLLKAKLLHSFAFTAIICCCAFAAFAQPDIGRSYINVTKGTNGGTIETGDTLEIRSSFVVRAGTFDSCAYYDAVPAGVTYIPGTLRVLTNEGKIYKQFTDAYGDDPGYIIGGNITINLGYNSSAGKQATAFRRGRIINTDKPSFYGSACIMIASFRVKVTAATGTNIVISGGTMTYKSGAGVVKILLLNNKTIQVYPNYGICSNTVGTNAIGTESNGTFGSGKAKDRGPSANVPAGYGYKIFDTGTPNDYYYGISNNTSTKSNYTTSNAWPIPDGSSPTHRVFNVWDIIGDHTGAASPTLGNPPADTVNGTGGYMLVINSAYRIDSAFVQTISNLCPNTYYEISCWMRNICSYCGCDSNGKGASGGAGYIPTAPNDSSGVYPNLSFQVDGIDYYTTGNLLHTGQWVKKGFTYLTGPAQTSFNLKFFNNAPGGGGNDWALDDITVATCSPNMVYSPSNNPIVCKGNTIAISDTITSYFNNYTYYKWQRSTDAGATWNDITGILGPSSPYSVSGGWQYATSYNVPPANTKLSDSGDLYRVVVATTSSNLSDAGCSFSDAVKIITLNVIDCGSPLNVRFISFTGNAINGKAALNWSTSQENEPLTFDVEKSYDGINFTTIATVPSHDDFNSSVNVYSYNDPEQLTRSAYYRIKMKNENTIIAISRVIQLSLNPFTFSFLSVINPFNSSLVFDISSDKSGKANMELVDQLGKTVMKKPLEINTGNNHFELYHTDILPAGIYVLRIQLGDAVLQKKVLKQIL